MIFINICDYIIIDFICAEIKSIFNTIILKPLFYQVWFLYKSEISIQNETAFVFCLHSMGRNHVLFSAS